MTVTVGRTLAQATQYLLGADIATARLDALVLLEDVTERDRAWLLAHPEFEMSSAQEAQLQKLLARRAEHVPLAFVRGRTEFYGREFVVNEAVLEPRPESETIIDLFKKLGDLPALPQVADVGAGSGALGITAALERPEASVDLIEIDDKALEVAKTNVDKFTLPLRAIKSDLLAQTPQEYDVLLCNLPYVPTEFHINRAALHEPKIAIFGGPDGLDIYRQLFEQLQMVAKKPLYILTEALPSAHEALQAVATENDYTCQETDDFIQVFKFAK